VYELYVRRITHALCTQETKRAAYRRTSNCAGKVARYKASRACHKPAVINHVKVSSPPPSRVTSSRTLHIRSVVYKKVIATANRSRASAFVIDRVKIFLTCSLITTQNSVVVYHILCAHIRGPKNFGYAGAPPPGMGTWLTPRKHASPPPLLPC